MVTVLEEILLSKLGKFTYVVLVQGYMQMGKSTFVKFLCDKLSMQRFGCYWDHKKYCARNLEEFINLIDKYNDKIIVYEEASREIHVSRHYSDLNLFFNVLMQTQAYKHNLIFLVFPHSASISKQQRYFINLGLEVSDKIDEPDCKASVVRPTKYSRTFWKLDENDMRYKWWGKCYVRYDKDLEGLQRCKDYTTWLEETLKTDVMKDLQVKIKRSRKTTKQKIKEDIKQDIDTSINYEPIKIKRNKFDISL